MNAFAPALLETMRRRGGQIPLLHLHQRRLAASCASLGLPALALAPEARGEDRVIRAEVTSRGVTYVERPLGPGAAVRLIVSRSLHQSYRHKTVDREPFDRTLIEAREAGADDGILLTPNGLVAEAAIWTLFWWEGSQLAAPPLDLGILPAVSRARLEQVVGRVAEQAVRPGDLAGKSLLVANAARGVVEVQSLMGQPVPAHPDTPRLQDAFWP